MLIVFEDAFRADTVKSTAREVRTPSGSRAAADGRSGGGTAAGGASGG